MKVEIFTGNPQECARKINDWLEKESLPASDIDMIAQSAIANPLPNKEGIILSISVFYSRKR